jgi:Domain of unknown function (DUF5658)
MTPLRSLVGATCLTVCAALSLPISAAAEEKLDPAGFGSVVPETRPASLIPLYASFAAVQGIDIHSTYSGLERGGREANPILGTVVGSPAAFIAVKAGATAGTIYLAEKIWKRNRKAAIITMIGANIAYGVIASHNYSVGRRSVK